MTIDEIKTALKGKDYDFLRDNERLKDKLVLLTLGGSYAYGTNNETSDLDVRGCALNTASDLLGFTNFEQVINNATDTVIYSFNKLVPLLVDCNPNVIEILGCRPEHYFYLSDVGKQLIENRKMFLSRRAAHSFGGYADQQLSRLENALARDKMPQEMLEQHIRKSMARALHSFEDRHPEYARGSIKLYVDDSPREDKVTEVFADIHLDHYSARELKSLLNEISNVVGTYDKLNHRNHKKDDAHLNKHAMHLVRLYLMSFDILERGEIVTYREADRDFLLSIRNGLFQNPDGTYEPEFFDLIHDYEKRLQYDKANTDLPDKPDMSRIQEFVMDVNRKSL